MVKIEQTRSVYTLWEVMLANLNQHFLQIYVSPTARIQSNQRAEGSKSVRKTIQTEIGFVLSISRKS